MFRLSFTEHLQWARKCAQHFTYTVSNPCNNISRVINHIFVVAVQSPSRVQLFVTPWTSVHQTSLSIAISLSLIKLMSTESVMPSNHLIFYRPFLLLPSIFSSIRVFSNESVLHIRWPKYWSFSFSIVLAMNIQGWFPLGLTGLISLQSKGLSRDFYSITAQKCQLFGTQPSLRSNSHIWLLEKP